MLSTVQIVSPPATEPLSLDLVRQHCRIDQKSDDTLLTGYLVAARTMAEQYLGRALITQTLRLTVTPEATPRPWLHYLHGFLTLPRSPVQTVSTVTVMDRLGNATVVAAATLPIVPPAVLLGYRLDLAQVPSRLYIGRDTVLSDGRTLREVDLEYIQVELVAGYGDSGDAVPQPILNAILLYTGLLYEHRGDGGGEITMPQAFEWLLNPYRVTSVA